MGFLDSMKEIADVATKNVSSLSKSTSLKVETKMRIRDLKNEVYDINVEIRREYEKIGEMLVLEIKENVLMDDSEIQSIISDIDSKILKIKEINKNIEEIEKNLNDRLDDIERKKYE
ncbi:hypothetical protein [Clostridium sp.]|uniref:hypothetical protein n=1 Tax=Clostridium sp. TaxID=1506 RepID=UPI002FC82495